MTHDNRTPGPKRRDFVLVVAAAFAGTGGLLALWPLIAQMNPGADTSAPAGMEVDVLGIAVGQTITVQWRQRPVFIRHRTPEEIEQARAIEAKGLHDPIARNEALGPDMPARDANRVLDGHPQWLVVVALCTRDACVLASPGQAVLAPGESFACPCCNARFDTSGRVKAGPAPANLTVPRYAFVSSTRISLR